MGVHVLQLNLTIVTISYFSHEDDLQALFNVLGTSKMNHVYELCWLLVPYFMSSCMLIPFNYYCAVLAFY